MTDLSQSREKDKINPVVFYTSAGLILLFSLMTIFFRDYPADRGAGIGGGYLQHSLSAGLLAEYPEPVRAGTGYRYRGGRRHYGLRKHLSS